MMRKLMMIRISSLLAFESKVRPNPLNEFYSLSLFFFFLLGVKGKHKRERGGCNLDEQA